MREINQQVGQNPIHEERIYFTNSEDVSFEVAHIIPEKPMQIRPILHAIGWGSDIDMYTDFLHTLAQNGYEVWSITPPRQGTSRLYDGTITKITANKAAAIESLLGYIHDKGIGEVDMTAYSEGATYATHAALKAASDSNKAHVRSLILIKPAGIIDEDTTFQLIRRFASQAVGNVLRHPRRYMSARKHAVGMKSPLQAIHEATSIAHSNIIPTLQTLHSVWAVNIGLIAGKADTVFPADQLQAAARQTANIKKFVLLPTRHNGIHTHATLVANTVMQILSDFNS